MNIEEIGALLLLLAFTIAVIGGLFVCIREIYEWIRYRWDSFPWIYIFMLFALPGLVLIFIGSSLT
jgi:hypothetical protein